MLTCHLPAAQFLFSSYITIRTLGVPSLCLESQGGTPKGRGCPGGQARGEVGHEEEAVKDPSCQRCQTLVLSRLVSGSGGAHLHRRTAAQAQTTPGVRWLCPGRPAPLGPGKEDHALPRHGTPAPHQRGRFGGGRGEDGSFLPAWEGERVSPSGSGKTVGNGDREPRAGGRLRAETGS